MAKRKAAASLPKGVSSLGLLVDASGVLGTFSLSAIISLCCLDYVLLLSLRGVSLYCCSMQVHTYTTDWSSVLSQYDL